MQIPTKHPIKTNRINTHQISGYKFASMPFPIIKPLTNTIGTQFEHNEPT